jgi:nucleotide-binding universal stress UspA family protein
MKSILVPVNFSSCAANAARYAADLALAIRADLHLLHVLEAPADPAGLMMTESLYQEMADAANLSLQQLQVELSRLTHQKIRIGYSLEAGRVPAKVGEFCQEMKPYAIVLGATGPTLEKFLTGSAVAPLLRHLAYPVIVVPESAVFHHFTRILLACDPDDIGTGLPNSLPLLKDLRDHFGSRFDIVTVETHQKSGEGRIAGPGEGMTSGSTEATNSGSGGWKELLKDLYPEIHTIRAPKVEDGILEYLSHHDADLVMVFPKKHGLFDFHTSQSRKLAQHSPVPVLSLHQ